MEEPQMAAHITVNGKPYCVEEDGVLFPRNQYPTNCGHATHESAEEGRLACAKLRPDVDFQVIDGACSSDPFWDTDEGIKIIRDRDESLWDDESQYVGQNINLLTKEEWQTIHNALSNEQSRGYHDSVHRFKLQTLMDKVRDNYIAK